MSDTNNNSQGGGNRQPRRNNNNRNRNSNGNNGQRRNNNNNNRKRHNRKPKPLKLTTWQKILKALGLFNEEKAREAQRKQNAANKKGDQKKAPKSNVRNAKTGNTGAGNKPNRRKPQPVPVESARLYVGNLSYDATEFDLEELFKGVGTVKKVEIIYNRNTHKSKGYGFIQMLNTDEAKRAVEVLHDQPFMGRQLVVNGSKARNENDSSNRETQAASADNEE